MDQILRNRQRVLVGSSGSFCIVEEFLGGGGQGEVYRAKLDEKAVALKWYYPGSSTAEQRKALETLIKRGAPSDRFLWPIELAAAVGISGFGYVMPLRAARFKGIVDMMKRRIEPGFRALVTAGLELS